MLLLLKRCSSTTIGLVCRVLPRCYPACSRQGRVTDYLLKMLARPTGFEPVASAFGGQALLTEPIRHLELESSLPEPGLIGGLQNRRLLFAGIRALDLGIGNRSPGRAPTQPILKRSIFRK